VPGSESGGSGGGAGSVGEGQGGGESRADEPGDGGGGGSATGDAAGVPGGEVPADTAGGGDGGDGEGRSSAGDPFGDSEGGRAAGQGGDEELDDSLGEFDREMSREQDEIVREGGGPAADSATAGRDESAGAGGDAGDPGKTTGAAAGGESPGVAVRDLGPDTETVATVEGCDDQDRVARQLCEAATKEDDPFLRAALWDEYNEYKKLITR